MRHWLTGLLTALLLFSAPGFADAQKETIGFAGADYWRAVKDGQEGVTTSRSPEHGVLISVPGQLWFEVKTKWVSPLGAIAIFGSLAMCGLMYWVVGPTKLSKPRTGRKLKRWSRLDRALHWTTAGMFLTLSGSGLAIIYGKHFIKPVVSMGVWENWIWFAKVFHNYVGPLFFLCLLGVLIKWFRHNIVNMVDVQWFMKAGGMLGPHKGSHPSAGFSNGGEKAIFWLLIWFGGIVVATGLFLDFPIFGQLRRQMEWASFIHIVGALILICGFIFHIYMGLFQLEGALEGMVTGEVDETWAREHHDLWYEEVKHQLDEPKAGKPG
ncbi:formate dehydrogenase subunit gamma [Aeromonas dhakensis]|uniref:formate dehydrogenase subunit gamma n=1 Tax=Aeromonas dhakensis TaxID=196024 RepID=UPI0024410068|nr:formate dehydrogenase subunit gamma [Aeromonas dhakensis]HDX8615858.1 formate dehydrogenase subunit gamma [Aeromonas dhakensis]